MLKYIYTNIDCDIHILKLKIIVYNVINWRICEMKMEYSNKAEYCDGEKITSN